MIEKLREDQSVLTQESESVLKGKDTDLNLKESLESKEAELKALTQELKFKNEEISALKAQLDHLDHDDVNDPGPAQPSDQATQTLKEENEKLKAEIKAKSSELSQMAKEISNLKAELSSAKDIQINASPNKLRTPSTNQGLSEITPIKENALEPTNRELYTHTTSDEHLGIEYQLQLEVSNLRDQNALLQEEVQGLKRITSPAYPIYSKYDYTPFKHSRTRTVDLAPRSFHGQLSTRSKDQERSPEKHTFQFKYSSPTNRTTRIESRSPDKRSPTPGVSSTLSGFKPVFRSAYIKPTKGSVTNYITSQQYLIPQSYLTEFFNNSNKLYVNKVKTLGTDSKAFQTVINLDSVTSNTPDSFESIDSEFDQSHVVGRNFLFVIYGAKREIFMFVINHKPFADTDKKHLKYKIIDDFVRFFRNLGNNGNIGSKSVIMKIKMNDPNLSTKLESEQSDQGVAIRKEKQFTLDEVNYSQLEAYLDKIKMVDTSPVEKEHKAVGNSIKQSFLEFSFEDNEISQEDHLEDAQNYFNAVTRVMIVTTNVICTEQTLAGINTTQGLTDLVLSHDGSLAAKTHGKEFETVKKHFIFTIHPTVQNYKITLNTLLMASKAETLCRELGFDERNLAQQNRLLREAVENSKLRIRHLENDLRANSSLLKQKEHSSHKERRNFVKDKERTSTEYQEMTKKLDYYAKRHIVLKENMKTLLTLLDQLTTAENSANNPANPQTTRNKNAIIGNQKLDKTSKAVKKLITQIE